MARKKRQASTMRRLHRSFGAGAAFFVIFMVLSGLAINHSNGLGLDKHHVSQPFLLDWYGLGGPANIRSYEADGNWLSFAGAQLYFNDDSVATVSNGVGVVSSGAMLIAAGSKDLLLLDHLGRLVERLPWGPIGKGSIESVGLLKNGQVVVKSAGQLWLADVELLNWRQTEDTSISPAWSSPKPAPATLHQAITQQYRGDGLNLERLLLDFHSGRIFGSIGVLVYDLLALSVGFLAISGLILWLRGRRNGKREDPRL
jgi:hypothetical protein